MVQMIMSLLGTVGLAWFLMPLVTKKIINIGNITGILFFGCLLLAGIFYRRLEAWIPIIRQMKTGNFAVLFMGGIIIAGVVTGMILSVLMAGAASRQPEGDTTLVVLGCRVYGERPSLMLRERMDAAYLYLEEHPKDCAVLSGGTGAGEDISEAECMYRYLTNKGIDGSRLYREDRSTSTIENLKYSMEIIRENGLKEPVTIVTNEFHQYRARQIAKDLKAEPYAVSGRTAWWLLPTFWVREWYGILQQIFI